MATRVCPECGSQYVASVRRCISCDVALVEAVDPDAAPADSEAVSAGDGEQVAYELEGWGNQLKVTLEGMLDRAGVLRVWESGALVVPAASEELVDELVATVEGGDAPELDEAGTQVAFEIQGLDSDELADLDARLIAAHLAHAWDEDGALLVGEADEEPAAAMIDEVLAGPDDAEPDGLATHQALSELYVAVDKLVKDPADAKLVRRYRTAAQAVVELSVPYGLTGAEWNDLTVEAARLADLAGPAETGEDEAPGDVEADDDEAQGEAQDKAPAEEAPQVPETGRLEMSRSSAQALRERLRDLV
ncbi:MAG: hypothetical protein ACR2LA_02235 [Acidimicrobiales bacterium]